jgi:hypothetical protein
LPGRVEASEEFNDWFVISARKTARLVEQLRQAEWKSSPKTDGDAECEFLYQPDGWKKAYRFVALRYEKVREEREAEEPKSGIPYRPPSLSVSSATTGLPGIRQALAAQ